MVPLGKSRFILDGAAAIIFVVTLLINLTLLLKCFPLIAMMNFALLRGN